MSWLNNLKFLRWLLSVAVVSALGFLPSCSDDDFGEVNDDQSPAYHPGKGLFVVNEGNFTNGNGSLSFINFEENIIYNDVFFNQNGKPLGDVPQSMIRFADELLVVVNNSGYIERLGLSDMKSKGRISGFTSPRFILPINNNTAYVSDLHEPFLWIVDLNTNSITGKVLLDCPGEQMLISNNLVFTNNWTSLNNFDNTTVSVIDPKTHEMIGQIEVTKEPNSIVLDQNDDLWVLSSGGYLNEEVPALQKINTQTREVEKILEFPEQISNPSALCINAAGDELFFLNQGVFSCPVNASAIPVEALVPQEDGLFYQLYVSGQDHIFVSDALDYQQKGYVYLYGLDGEKTAAYLVGIIPGQMLYVD